MDPLPTDENPDIDDLYDESLKSEAWTPGLFSGNLGDLIDPRGNMHKETHDVEGFFAINNGAWESGDGDGMYQAPFQSSGLDVQRWT